MTKREKKAVIFDFNGTMFFDSDKHEQAWCLYLEQEIGKKIGQQEYQSNVHGKDNADIIRSFWGKEVSQTEIIRRSEEKESLYRELCLKDEKNFHLAEGLPEFLDILKEKGIAMTIATSAEQANIEFYFDHFSLSHWFQPDRIVYQNGSFPGKPNPAIYLKAAELLETSPCDCLVFEDSGSGIMAAHRAGIQTIVGVDSAKDNSYFKNFPFLKVIIKNFRQLDLLLSLL